MFIADYGKELVSLIVPFIAWLLNVGAKPKAKLIWTSPHAFTFLVQDPLTDEAGNQVQATKRVCTASVRVMNSGRETAHKVELVFNWRPQHLNLWPVRSFEEKTDSDGRHMLIFDNLAPKEEIGIEIMSVNHDLPALLQVRSAECLAKNVQLMWFIKVANWRIQVARTLVFIGFATSIYWMISLLQILILKTPLIS
jgi:hypothetical protein